MLFKYLATIMDFLLAGDYLSGDKVHLRIPLQMVWLQVLVVLWM